MKVISIILILIVSSNVFAGVTNKIDCKAVLTKELRAVFAKQKVAVERPVEKRNERSQNTTFSFKVNDNDSR